MDKPDVRSLLRLATLGCMLGMAYGSSRQCAGLNHAGHDIEERLAMASRLEALGSADACDARPARPVMQTDPEPSAPRQAASDGSWHAIVFCVALGTLFLQPGRGRGIIDPWKRSRMRPFIHPRAFA